MPTPILEKESLIPGRTSKLVLHAPQIARNARPGHFVMLRMSPEGERIPLTIADTDPEKGTIVIVYLVMGKSTALLEDLKAGDSILDVCGPLGKPTHIEKKGTVVCVGGGTGIAAMHHIAKGHWRAGNRVVGVIGARTEVTASVLTGAKVGEDCTVGPFAYLRKGADIADGCRIGDFVEVKNARVGEGTKVAHLTYVGDCEIGKGCNIGCGVVFVNYDGKRKNRTVVGDRCFIGSNCNIIAPVSIKDGCYIAAGTTVTDDVGKDDLVIGRVRQVVKPGRARGRFC